MGADLYIKPIFDRQRREWEPQFEKAASLRDRLQPGSEEHKKAQARVEECFEKIYARGYFRDPYNNYDLLWKFGLSWWDDVIPMLNTKGDLSVEQASRFLELLKEHHSTFLETISPLPSAARKDYLDRYAELQKFINDAIELNMPIHASL